MNDDRDRFLDSFVSAAGEIAELFTFNRSIGQLYGYLYLSHRSVPLEEIAKACRMSKGNASLHLRTLESWGAVQRSWQPGTRKDYYTANTNLKQLAIRRLQSGVSRRLDHARTKFNALKNDPALKSPLKGKDDTHWDERLGQIESLLQEVERGFSLLPKLLKLKSLFS